MNYALCTMNSTKGRFAPSPTGRMHLGNMFCALLSWLSAKSKGGEWLLRIEDIDPDRSRKEYAEQLMDDLCWIGLEWDGEPVLQSQRTGIYEHYFRLLQQRGLTYPCYCTRADILATQAPHESDGRVVYKGTCRHLSPQLGRRGATRLMVTDHDIVCADGHYGEYTVNLTSSYVARMALGLTNWLWLSTMRRWGLPRWCVAETCCSLRLSRCMLLTCWAFPYRNSSISLCSATARDSGSQSVTRVSTWDAFGRISLPDRWSADWLSMLGLLLRPTP